jgi:hypothetical protein
MQPDLGGDGENGDNEAPVQPRRQCIRPSTPQSEARQANGLYEQRIEDQKYSGRMPRGSVLLAQPFLSASCWEPSSP